MALVFIKSALEHLSSVWVELTLALVVAIAYLALAGRARQRATAKLKAKTVEIPICSDQEPTPMQLAIKPLRQGKVIEAIDILNELPEINAGNVPDGIAQNLLLVTSSMPRSNDVMNKLRTLTGKLSSSSLDAA